jgi:hypothetical protein
MNPKFETQHNAYQFLKRAFEEDRVFSFDDLLNASGWTHKTLKTYFSKQFKALVAKSDSGYRVTETFRLYSEWAEFRGLVTQVRALPSSYKKWRLDKVVILEFYMPLSNEAHLRNALDALFYRDTLERRINRLNVEEIEGKFPAKAKEARDAYIHRLCLWLSSKFVGYSISHVSGRFRHKALATRNEALDSEKQGARYLADETTAVTRFIIPCKNRDEALQVKWFFDKIFVESIIEVVNKEDEIWMVESGMESSVNIWSLQEEEHDGDDESKCDD